MWNRPPRSLLIVGLMATGLLLGANAPRPGNPDAVRQHAHAMVAMAKDLVTFSDERQWERVMKHAERFLAEGQAAIEAAPFPGNRHARDTVEHLSEAMNQVRSAAEHARQGRDDVASTQMRKALRHARRGLSHALAL